MTEYRKKLIEVALPLEAINRASAREKSIRHGHPSTLHLWWARRPLAACRAVLFASLVDDPSSHPEHFPTEDAQEAERQRLFRIIEELVEWKNSTSETVLATARTEILRSTGGNPPPVLDPFCGGGSIPLEAQRLGLEAHGSDLNPVAVLITKALIEIPPEFSDLPPVNPATKARLGGAGWRGPQGLAEDVDYYGRWMREEAERRIGHLYPKVTLPSKTGNGDGTVIAWLWARTMRCPNPACGAEMPLVRSFELSKKTGKRAWIEPVVDENRTVRFEVRGGSGVAPEGTVNRQGARCVVCGSAVPFNQVRAEGRERGLGVRLMAIIAEGTRGRVYVAADDTQTAVAESATPSWKPEAELPHNPRDFKTPNYGMTSFADLFTSRQLVALTTFSDLAREARERVRQDADAAWQHPDWTHGSSASPSGYADAVATYLGLVASRLADYHSSICSWHSGRETIRNTFARQAIPMVWDFAEANPLSESTGSMTGALKWIVNVVRDLPGGKLGSAEQLDAVASCDRQISPLISTDPPYYDNIGYADLSDFFYSWLRPTLRQVYPTLFSTLQTPKSQELVATPYRFEGGKRQAQEFFETGLGAVFRRFRETGHPEYPLTVYYAFKQAEAEGETEGATASTGWETMLTGLLKAGFAITGTWPMRSEMGNRPMASGTNALASSIVLVCRLRPESASLATRKDFMGALRAELPDALRKLQHGNIAPVDLAQASIGPGMAIYSRHSKVMEADGSTMPVRTALALINQALDEVLAEQEGELDADTRWAIAWFEQVGNRAGDFGDAETLSKAKGTSVDGMVRAGILEARGGKVRLLGRDELDEAWSPSTDQRLTVWEMTQHLLRRLDEGEVAAAALARQLGSFAEVARDLAYRLYLICERSKWSQEGQAYNSLVVAWPSIMQLAAVAPASAGPSQTSFEV